MSSVDIDENLERCGCGPVVMLCSAVTMSSADIVVKVWVWPCSNCKVSSRLLLFLVSNTYDCSSNAIDPTFDHSHTRSPSIFNSIIIRTIVHTITWYNDGI